MRNVTIPLPILSDRRLSPVAKLLWCGISLCEGCNAEAAAGLVNIPASDVEGALAELLDANRATLEESGTVWAVSPVDPSRIDAASLVLSNSQQGRAAAAIEGGRARRDARVQEMEERRQRSDYVEPIAPEEEAKPANVVDVEGWFREAIQKKHGRIRIGRWGLKEKALAKRLLEDFGEEIVHKGVLRWVDDPQRFLPSFEGVASINGLYGCRNGVMGEVQGVQALAPKPGFKGEYVPPNKENPPPGMGW